MQASEMVWTYNPSSPNRIC